MLFEYRSFHLIVLGEFGVDRRREEFKLLLLFVESLFQALEFACCELGVVNLIMELVSQATYFTVLGGVLLLQLRKSLAVLGFRLLDLLGILADERQAFGIDVFR